MRGRSQAHQGAGGSGAHHHHHHADDTQPTAVGGRELAAERVPSASPSERAPDRPTVDLRILGRKHGSSNTPPEADLLLSVGRNAS